MKKIEKAFINTINSEPMMEQMIANRIKDEFNINCICDNSFLRSESVLINIFRSKSELEIRELKRKLEIENQWYQCKVHNTYFNVFTQPLYLMLSYIIVFISIANNNISLISLMYSYFWIMLAVVILSFLQADVTKFNSRTIIYNNFKINCIDKIYEEKNPNKEKLDAENNNILVS